MMPSIHQIPVFVRALLKYHRLLREALFGKKELNHRALAGFFLLRLIVYFGIDSRECYIERKCEEKYSMILDEWVQDMLE